MNTTLRLLPLYIIHFTLYIGASGALTIELPSPHQGGNTTLFILLPDSLQNTNVGQAFLPVPLTANTTGTSTTLGTPKQPDANVAQAAQPAPLASQRPAPPPISPDATTPSVSASALQPFSPSALSYPVLYILPTYATPKAAQNAIDQLAALDAANKYQAICVAPSFNQTPWFADHPADPAIQQERHLLETVLPHVEKNFPANTTRHLVGFSKSGWGAFTLLFRHPGTFTRAASWDAPLAMEKIGKWGTLENMGTQENYDLYFPPNLIKTAAPILSKSPPRLILLGHALFTDDLPIHAQLLAAKIPHYHDHGPQLFHSWNSGWLPVALQLLFTPDLSTVSKIPIIETPASLAGKKAKSAKSNAPKK